MAKCEYCGKEHDGTYGSGRFCCAQCARKYSKQFIRKTKVIKCQLCGCEFEVSVHSSVKNCPECRQKLNFIAKVKKYNLPQELKTYYINQHLNINQDKQHDLYNKILEMGYIPSEVHKNNNVRIKFVTNDTFHKLQLAGLKSSTMQSDKRRSKNEKYFCELCENNFKNVLHNEPLFNGWDADVILLDYKIAVLWNGAWHYKKITKQHSVKQVQNRDKIKIEEIKKANFIPYIIKDMGKYNKHFVEKEFENFRNFFNI